MMYALEHFSAQGTGGRHVDSGYSTLSAENMKF